MTTNLILQWLRALMLVAVLSPMAIGCGDDGDDDDDMAGDDDDDMAGDDDDDDTPVPGCTNDAANNYNPAATVDDGTCLFDLTLSVDVLGISDFDPKGGVCVTGTLTTEDCEAMSQVGDSTVWTVTLELLATEYTYNFQAGGTDEFVPEVCGTEDTTPVRAVTVPDIGPEVATVAFSACTVLPFAVDGQYSASGFFGDGEVPGNITVAESCPERGGDARGACRTWTYTRGGQGFGGVVWQFPEGNFGELPGYPIPRGATRVSFAAWGEAGGERVEFFSGIDGDGFEGRTTITLTDEPTVYTLDLVGQSYGLVVGGWGWVAELGMGAGPITFFTDDVVYDFVETDLTTRRGCTDENAMNYDPTATEDDGSCRYLVTFNVDMGCSGLESFSTVHLTGPFCGFCGSGFDLTDPDEDDIYTGTFDFGVDQLDEMGRLEHLYIVDVFSAKEDLYDDVLDGGMCAPINGPDDGSGNPFANRLIPVTSGDVVTNDTFSSCDACP